MTGSPAVHVRRARSLFALTLALSLVLFLAPTVPGEDDVPDLPAADKLVHAAVFAALGALAPAAFPSQRLAWLAGTLAAYALLTEALQAPLPRREADVLDVVADFAGLALGLALGARRDAGEDGTGDPPRGRGREAK